MMPKRLMNEDLNDPSHVRLFMKTLLCKHIPQDLLPFIKVHFDDFIVAATYWEQCKATLDALREKPT